MSKKMIFTTVLMMAFSINSFAAMNKGEAAKRLNEQHATEVSRAESVKKAFEEKKDWSKLTAKQQKDLSDSMTVLASKISVNPVSLRNVYLRKADILVDVVRLEDAMKNGSATEKEAARTQVELIENVGKSLDSSNYSSKEAKAATKLLQLDLTTLPPKATEVVKTVNDNLRQGKSLVESIKEGTKGMKGTLDDLISCLQA